MYHRFTLVLLFCFCSWPCFAGETPLLTQAKTTYIEVATFSAWAGTTVTCCEETGDLILASGSHSLELKIGSKAGVFDGVSVRLPAAPVRSKGLLYLPMNAVAAKFDLILEPDTAHKSITIHDTRVGDTIESPLAMAKKAEAFTRFKAPLQEAKKHYHDGLQFRRKEAYTEAQRELETAVRLSPDYAEAQMALGRLYIEVSEPDKAREVFTGLIQRSPFSRTRRLAKAALSNVHPLFPDMDTPPKAPANKSRRSNASPLVGTWECTDLYSDGPGERQIRYKSTARYIFRENGEGEFQFIWTSGIASTLTFRYHTDHNNIILEYTSDFGGVHPNGENNMGKVVVGWSISDDKTRLTITGDLRSDILKSGKALWEAMSEGGISDIGPYLISNPEPSIYARK